jgi:hypothetical protein
MSKVDAAIHEFKPDPKQINIPYDGQLSKQGTVVKCTRTSDDVDYSIAAVVEKINQAGFKSKFSCSGLKKDHPFKSVNPDGAYISFLYEENDARALTLIEKAAMSLNMTVEYCRMSRKPAVIVRIDKDRTGHSLSDRIRMAGKEIADRCGITIRNSFGADTKDLQTIIKRNGGLIYDTDEKIETVWNQFVNVLLFLNYQNAG